MINKDLVIIGGGSAGLAAAIKARQEGIKDILIIEKDGNLGGILNQCIHNGFGLEIFNEELTGPEYAYRFKQIVKDKKIEYLLNTSILSLDKGFFIKYINESGVNICHAKCIIFAGGCYERNAGAINLMGDRPSGIFTAGCAQKYINIKGYMPAKKVVILGSGDIGLITARRMTLEGANVLAVLEIMPYSNGLNRNIKQCLDDFNIPLYLSCTVKKVIGKSRLEKIIAGKVDENLNFIDGEKIEFDCDTLLLSVGLVPNISILNNLGIEVSSTKGPKVDEIMQTNVSGLFAAGNCVHVHDLVDFVTNEGYLAGFGAALYLKNQLKEDLNIDVVARNNVSYVVPNKIKYSSNKELEFKFRVKKPCKNVDIIIKNNDQIIKKVYKLALLPSQMENIKINTTNSPLKDGMITIDIETRA